MALRRDGASNPHLSAEVQQDKRGITLYVNGQTIAGAVTRVEPGRWVELKNQTSGKIVVRIDRIDAIAAP